MNTLLVWALITVSAGTYNGGNVQIVGNFKTEEACRKVEKQIPNKWNTFQSNCVQAEIVITK